MAPQVQGTSQANKTIVRQVVEEIWNNGNLDLIDQIFSDKLVSEDSVAAVLRPHGLEGPVRELFKRDVMMIRTALPDIHYTIEDIIAEGDKTVTRWTARGTHKGSVLGIPPTGKSVSITGHTSCEIQENKIVHHDTHSDIMVAMLNLGILSAARF